MNENQTNYQDLLNTCSGCFEEYDMQKIKFCPFCNELNEREEPKQLKGLIEWCEKVQSKIYFEMDEQKKDNWKKRKKWW